MRFAGESEGMTFKILRERPPYLSCTVLSLFARRSSGFSDVASRVAWRSTGKFADCGRARNAETDPGARYPTGGEDGKTRTPAALKRFLLRAVAKGGKSVNAYRCVAGSVTAKIALSSVRRLRGVSGFVAEFWKIFREKKFRARIRVRRVDDSRCPPVLESQVNMSSVST